MLEIASLGYSQAGIKDAVGLWRAGAIDEATVTPTPSTIAMVIVRADRIVG